jgi:TonB family protein
MFDRLIESDTAGAEFKSRRRYFVVSTVVVGALFVSAVVFSIYASEIGLGNDSYELTALLTPVQPPADAPEPPQPQQPRQKTSDERSTDEPSRVVNQQRPDETPTGTPPISVTQNANRSRPFSDFKIDGIDRDLVGAQDPEPPTGGSVNGIGTPSTDNISIEKPEPKVDNGPPPPPVNTRPKYIGVINGKATYLPKPVYPAPAVAMGVQGAVNVQVTIDEAGNVTSAKAASGNPLLRGVAESAALKAKFSPTYLSKVPVKVTGVIVYNFTRN